MYDPRPFKQSRVSEIAFQYRDGQRVSFNKREFCFGASKSTLEEDVRENTEVTATGPAVNYMVRRRVSMDNDVQ